MANQIVRSRSAHGICRLSSESAHGPLTGTQIGPLTVRSRALPREIEVRSWSDHVIYQLSLRFAHGPLTLARTRASKFVKNLDRWARAAQPKGGGASPRGLVP